MADEAPRDAPSPPPSADDARPTLREVARASVRTWSHGGARFLSGAVAFYSLLSVVPVLMIAIQLAGLATDENAARHALLQNLTRWVGPSGAGTLAAMLSSATHAARHRPWVLEALVLAYASTRVFTQLQRALHQLWDVPLHSPERFAHKVLTQLYRRALAVAVVACVGLTLVALVLWNGFVAWATPVFGSHPRVWQVASAGVSFTTTVMLFTAIFKVLPEARIQLRDAALGGLVTAVMFTLGATLVGVYIGRKATESFFGAASSLVMLLLWVNYSAQVFFLGASFTGVHARLRGGGIQPRG